jgi:hypothetical protein
VGAFRVAEPGHGKTLASAGQDRTLKLWDVSPADASKSQPDMK